MDRKIIYVDLDKTLTNGEKFWIGEPTPNKEMIDAVNRWYRAGHCIIIWTARSWKNAVQTAVWLIKNNIHFNGLFMEKGMGDFYLDDKAFSNVEDIDKILDE